LYNTLRLTLYGSIIPLAVFVRYYRYTLHFISAYYTLVS